MNEEIVRKGRAAQTLLENPDFILIMDTVRLKAYRDWAKTEPSQVTTREENYNLLRAIDALTENLESLVANARFEEAKAERDQPQQQEEIDD